MQLLAHELHGISSVNESPSVQLLSSLHCQEPLTHVASHFVKPTSLSFSVAPLVQISGLSPLSPPEFGVSGIVHTRLLPEQSVTVAVYVISVVILEISIFVWIVSFVDIGKSIVASFDLQG